MANAKRDGNFIPAILGTSSSDGVTTIPPYTDPTTHRLYTDATTTEAPPTSVTSGSKTGTSGTTVALVSVSTTCKHIAIYAYVGNSGTVAVGDSSCVADTGKNGKGEQLIQGAATTVYIDDASKIYLSAATGDGVSFCIYE